MDNQSGSAASWPHFVLMLNTWPHHIDTTVRDKSARKHVEQCITLLYGVLGQYGIRSLLSSTRGQAACRRGKPRKTSLYLFALHVAIVSVWRQSRPTLISICPLGRERRFSKLSNEPSAMSRTEARRAEGGSGSLVQLERRIQSQAEPDRRRRRDPQGLCCC